MLKKTLLVILSLVVIIALSSYAAYYLWMEAVDPSYPNGDMRVCVTATGSKYHLPSCSYLHSSSIEVSLEDARNKGYGSCSRCDPPSLITQEVYLERRENQSILLRVTSVLLLSFPASFGLLMIIGKIEDLTRCFDSFPDWFIITAAVSIYIAVCIQGFRLFIIW